MRARDQIPAEARNRVLYEDELLRTFRGLRKPGWSWAVRYAVVDGGFRAMVGQRSDEDATEFIECWGADGVTRSDAIHRLFIDLLR